MSSTFFHAVVLRQIQTERGRNMDSLLNMLASLLAAVTYGSAVAGAGLASASGAYQPDTPVLLLK